MNEEISFILSLIGKFNSKLASPIQAKYRRVPVMLSVTQKGQNNFAKTTKLAEQGNLISRVNMELMLTTVCP